MTDHVTWYCHRQHEQFSQNFVLFTPSVIIKSSMQLALTKMIFVV